ncbi:MAG: helix-hairpin-helix domain-containing protein [Candidatus Kapabacteria bacterium]|jgi:DNA polymerase (family 10)|nr:helix-hairpin-helix domain-containing protein [Candidatus Kapabacteria bacterium]
MNEQIIKILENISKLLEIKGESFFKFSAYSNAAEILRKGDYNIVELVITGKLSEIKGIGKALTEKITDYVMNGNMLYYELLTAEYPESLIELLKIEGFGPKKVFQVFNELNVKTVTELEDVINSGALAKLKGFTSAGVNKIIDSIDAFKSNDSYKERKIDFDQIQ